LISALLCTFQIITHGASSTFNDIEEKEFTNALFTVISLTYIHRHEIDITDKLTILKTLMIALI